jgi:hypothetical protein
VKFLNHSHTWSRPTRLSCSTCSIFLSRNSTSRI